MIDGYERTYKTYLRDDYDTAAMSMSTMIMRNTNVKIVLNEEESMRL